MECHGVRANGKHAAAALVAHEATPLDGPRLSRLAARIAPEDRSLLLDIFAITDRSGAAGPGGAIGVGSKSMLLLLSSGPLAMPTPEQEAFSAAHRHRNM